MHRFKYDILEVVILSLVMFVLGIQITCWLRNVCGYLICVVMSRVIFIIVMNCLGI